MTIIYPEGGIDSYADVNSVTNTDGYLTVSPTTGNVVVNVNLSALTAAIGGSFVQLAPASQQTEAQINVAAAKDDTIGFYDYNGNGMLLMTDEGASDNQDLITLGSGSANVVIEGSEAFGVQVYTGSAAPVMSFLQTEVQINKPLWMNGSTTGYVSLTVPASITSYQLVWPNAQGASSTYLKNDGSGNLSWATVSSGVTSVSNSDGTITVSPTTGAVVISLALSHPNTWTGTQTFGNNISIGGYGAFDISSPATGDIWYYNGTNMVNLPIGTAGQVLGISSGIPAWQNQNNGGPGTTAVTAYLIAATNNDTATLGINISVSVAVPAALTAMVIQGTYAEVTLTTTGANYLAYYEVSYYNSSNTLVHEYLDLTASSPSWSTTAPTTGSGHQNNGAFIPTLSISCYASSTLTFAVVTGSAQEFTAPSGTVGYGVLMAASADMTTAATDLAVGTAFVYSPGTPTFSGTGAYYLWNTVIIPWQVSSGTHAYGATLQGTMPATRISNAQVYIVSGLSNTYSTGTGVGGQGPNGAANAEITVIGGTFPVYGSVVIGGGGSQLNFASSNTNYFSNAVLTITRLW